MSYISIQNLTFSYSGAQDNIFENVSLQIDGSWKLGLIGRNGRGKTTLLNLILGKYEYSGKISSDMEFAYFPYIVDDKDRMTLDVMSEICPQAEDWEFIKELSLLDMDAECLYRDFSTLSNGEQTKALLAALFSGENRFLLIDEPTNHVDEAGRAIICEYLKRKKGFILVSHDAALLDSCIDHVISINRTTIDIQQGNFSSWWENFKRNEQNEITENEKLKKDVRRLSEAARQSAGWSDKVEKRKKGSTNSGSRLDKGFVGHKSAKMMQRSKNFENRMQKAAEKKSQLLKDVDRVEPLKMETEVYFKTTLISAKDLAVYYGEGAFLFENLSFEICRGDRAAVIGKNGSGKSTLLKLLMGENIRYQGKVTVGNGLNISYVSQDTSFLKGVASDYAADRGIDLTRFLTILRKLGFEREQFSIPMESMSEGQKKKILIAGSLCEKAHIYLWDEPLNYIDVITRMQIRDVLLEYGPTMLFVEHDTAFRETIATKEIVLL